MSGSVKVPRRTVDLFDVRSPFSNGDIPIWSTPDGQWISTASNAVLNAILPSQVGQSGKVLTTNGTNTSWVSGGGGGSSDWSDLTGVASTIPLDGQLSFTDAANAGVEIARLTYGALTFFQDQAIVGANWQGDPIALSVGGTGSNLSATGGTHQFLKQNTAGGAIVPTQPSFSDLSGSISLSQFSSVTAHLALLGPTSGSAAAPSFRNIQIADLPTSPITPGYYTFSRFQISAAGTITDITAPNADVSAAGFKITNLADGTATTDTASWGQTQNLVSSVTNGLDWKASVRIAVTSNVNIASPGTSLDGVTLVSGNRVLLTGQTTGSQNGIYVFNGSAVPMTRATDSDVNAEVTSGLTVQISEGTHSSALGILTTSDPITVDTTALSFTFISGPGQYVSGTGINISGNSIAISSSYLGQASITTVGTITTGVWNAGNVTANGTLTSTGLLHAGGTWSNGDTHYIQSNSNGDNVLALSNHDSHGHSALVILDESQSEKGAFGRSNLSAGTPATVNNVFIEISDASFGLTAGGFVIVHTTDYGTPLTTPYQQNIAWQIHPTTGLMSWMPKYSAIYPPTPIMTLSRESSPTLTLTGTNVLQYDSTHKWTSSVASGGKLTHVGTGVDGYKVAWNGGNAGVVDFCASARSGELTTAVPYYFSGNFAALTGFVIAHDNGSQGLNIGYAGIQQYGSTTLSLDAAPGQFLMLNTNAGIGIQAGSGPTTLTDSVGKILSAALNTVQPTVGGTGLTSYALGDVVYSSATNTLAKLSGNTTTTKKFFSQTGNGTVSAAPSWATVTKSDVGLSSVENTALSSWAGTTNIVTIGTIATGTWQGSTVDVAHGGTGNTSFTAFAPLFGGTTTTGPVQSGTVGTSGQFLISNGPGVLPTIQTFFRPIGVGFATTPAVLTATAVPIYYTVQSNCTILAYRVLADVSGSITITCKKCTYSNFPTTSDITGGANIVLTSARKNEDTVLSTWSPSLLIGDIVEFAVIGTPVGATQVEVFLKVG